MPSVLMPAQNGYRPVHDLPTPPSTSRASPPLIYKDSCYKAPFTNPRGGSPFNQPMSAPHRGLPPPAALPPVQQLPGHASSQSSSSLAVGQVPPPPPLSQNHSQSQSLGQLPPAPSWHDESMRAWLSAKSEEDKRKQEEERTRQEEQKTRQETIRLEQRKAEIELLRTSLHGGIPPPLVPVVFAGISGGFHSHQALEWVQQYVVSPSSQQHPPALMPPGQVSSEHQRRDSQAQAYAPYPASGGVPSTPGSAQGPPSSYMSGYPGSPTRPRGQSMPGTMGTRSLPGASTLPNLNTNISGGLGNSSGAPPSHSGVAHSQQHESQPSPSIYFHHWQPPTSQAGGGRSGTDQPATPSVGESPRKRKAAGPQPPVPPPSTMQRVRSPTFSQSATLSNPPPGRKRGHSRQRSDVGTYRSGGLRGRAESSGPGREMSPMHTSGTSSARESHEPSSQVQQMSLTRTLPPKAPSRTGAHSVSSLLSDNPSSPQVATLHFATPSGLSFQQHQQLQQQQQHHHQQMQQQQQHHQYGESERTSEEKMRSGGVPGSTATLPGDND
ncbi:hypothetical protein QBC42DRAFT_308358 [Cladorrhinum samala]|uniref:Uncharacterized protein n=1 Tax=Cladorrhinum samala TaxID=585594 RepID=A0AAV9HEY2_9PEZI|nr:hypothetical protein QBC42DRAFT_308358 [Cladorrhinum samala]